MNIIDKLFGLYDCMKVDFGEERQKKRYINS